AEREPTARDRGQIRASRREATLPRASARALTQRVAYRSWARRRPGPEGFTGTSARAARTSARTRGGVTVAEPFAPGGLPSPGPRVATRGMVASASPEAAAVGLRVLLEGGNAFDAAVATAMVEGLTLPASCGLGGDAFAVLYDARTQRVHAINGSGGA